MLSGVSLKVRDFLAGVGPGPRGDRLEEILALSDDQLEERHDFIQWLFPLPAPSDAVPDAPVIPVDELLEIGRDREAAAGVMAAFIRMLVFYGFTYGEGQSAAILQGENFNERAENWLPYVTHNDRRISRILRSMAFQGHVGEVKVFYEILVDLLKDAPGYRRQAIQYWAAAIRRDM